MDGRLGRDSRQKGEVKKQTAGSVLVAHLLLLLLQLLFLLFLLLLLLLQFIYIYTPTHRRNQHAMEENQTVVTDVNFDYFPGTFSMSAGAAETPVYMSPS